MPDDTSNRIDSGDDDDDNNNKNNNNFNDDEFSSNKGKKTAYKDNESNSKEDYFKKDRNNYSNIPSEPAKVSKSSAAKSGGNTTLKLKNIKINNNNATQPQTAAAATVNNKSKEITEYLFKMTDDNQNDDFGDFISNTDNNFADFNNFEAKAIVAPQPTAAKNIDDLFSCLTVDTTTTLNATTNKTSNIDDLFGNLNFSSPSIQPQFPISQTMPNIFQQQQQFPHTTINPIRPNVLINLLLYLNYI